MSLALTRLRTLLRLVMLRRTKDILKVPIPLVSHLEFLLCGRPFMISDGLPTLCKRLDDIFVFILGTAWAIFFPRRLFSAIHVE